MSAKVLTKQHTDKVKSFDKMSTRIRYLNDQGFTRGEISRHLTKVMGRRVRYQWVRNVLNEEVKNPTEKY